MLVTQLCLTLCDPMDCRPPGSSVHGVLQADILEWVAIFFSTGYSQARDQTHLSCTADRLFNHWATREALAMQKNNYIFIPCPEDPRRASKMIFTVNDIRFVISEEEDLTSGPGTRLDPSTTVNVMYLITEIQNI